MDDEDEDEEGWEQENNNGREGGREGVVCSVTCLRGRIVKVGSSTVYIPNTLGKTSFKTDPDASCIFMKTLIVARQGRISRSRPLAPFPPTYPPR